MVSKEEILNSRILGFIEPLGNNARVTVLGYKSYDSEYVFLDASKRKSIFYPEGKVFAGKFQFERDQNPISPYSFIEFSVVQSEKKVDFDGDDYIVDYNKPIKSRTFPRIISLNKHTALENGFFVNDEIFPLIRNMDIDGLTGYFFLKYEKKLYGLFQYDSNKEVIKPKTGKETNEYNIESESIKNNCHYFNGAEYYLGNLERLGSPLRSIDCMTDDQLAKWFKDLLEACTKSEAFIDLRKDDYQIFSHHFKAVDDEKLEECRFERIKGKIDSLAYTFDEMKELLTPDSTLVACLKTKMQEMKDDFKAEWAKNLQEEKEKLEKEISNLKIKKEKFSKDIFQIENDFNTKSEKLNATFNERKQILEKSINETEKNYKTIQDNYDLLVESLKLKAQLGENTASQTIVLEPIVFDAVGEKFFDLEQNEAYSISTLCSLNLKGLELSEIEKKQFDKDSDLFTHKACFIPSVSWAYLYAKAVRNSKLYSLHVEHDWLHYKDFVNNGLIKILKSCDENKEMNHVIVFDSLNLTQPECGLKPLLDAIGGYSVVLPVYNKPLPINLKIFATILPFGEENKIGLPLNKDFFLKWGQVCTPEDRIPLPQDFLECESQKGYFEPIDLDVKPTSQNKEWVNNGYFEE